MDDVSVALGGQFLSTESTEFGDECGGGGGGGGPKGRVEVKTDKYPTETTWTVKDKTSGAMIAMGGPYSAQNELYKKVFDVTAGKCYEFTIEDSFGDGICCKEGDGGYEVFLDGESVATGGKFQKSETKPVGECGGGGGGGRPVKVQVKTDNYPAETTWTVKDKASGVVIAKDGPFSAVFELYEKEFGVTADKCYEFAIEDAYGDGICCSVGSGYYAVSLDGEPLFTGGEFKKIETREIGKCGGGGGKNLQVNVKTDNYPGDTSWKLERASVSFDPVLIVTGGEYPNGGGYSEKGQVYSEEADVDPDGCLKFTIKDVWGDGICCSAGNGSYEVVLNGALVISGGTDVGYGETKDYPPGCA